MNINAEYIQFHAVNRVAEKTELPCTEPRKD